MNHQKVVKHAFKFGLMLMIMLNCFPASVVAQSKTKTLFRLSGKHAFEHKCAVNWKIIREDVDHKTGKSSLFEIAEPDARPKVTLDLRKSKNKETTYYVTAKSKDGAKKYRIRVFEPNEVSTFAFESKGNPVVRTYLFVPDSLSKRTRVIFAMHGLNRNADDYIASWVKWAKTNDHIVISPEFDQANWQRSVSYNLGNLFRGNFEKGELRPRSEWSFQVVEAIYETVRSGFGLSVDFFDMFGHSAGGQFVHRFALFMPDSKIRLALAANSGWYTLPDLDQKFPYGLKDARLSITKDDLLNWSEKHVFIFRGTADTNRDENLRQTPEAEEQGRNRFERAGYMFEQMKALNPGTNWRLVDVPTVAHDQTRMAIAAQYELDLINAEPQN